MDSTTKARNSTGTAISRTGGRPPDLAKFRDATRCIAEQYSRFTVGGGLHVQGELVTGEATADLGGLMLAWRALHALTARAGEASPGARSGSSRRISSSSSPLRIPGQAALRPEQAQELVTTDPHPPARVPHQRHARQQPGISGGVRDSRLEPHGQDGPLRHLVRFDSSRSFSLSRMRTGASAL